MTAESLGQPPSDSREIRIRHNYTPWFRRDLFLVAMLGVLVAFGALLLPPGRPSGSLQWAAILLYFFLVLAWVGLVITDEEKPTWLGALIALAFLANFAWLFYRYSGAQWDRLAFVFFNASMMEGDGWPSMLEALVRTVELALFGCLFAFLLGLSLAIIRSLNNRVLNVLVIAYVDIFRAIPTIVLAALVYYALPFMGILFPAFVAGVVTLGLNHGAYSSEIFRAGIESVHHGQIEAARSLGFNSIKTMRLVILPQALRVVIPPLTGQAVALMKETSICSTIGIIELMRQALVLQAWRANPTPLIVATIIYLVILIPLTRLARHLETRIKKG